MDFPPQVVSEPERNLSSHQIFEAQKSQQLRRNIVEKLTVESFHGDFSTELASYSDEFGFIFRYKLKKPETDTPAPYQIILWSKDSENFVFATLPSFSLEHLRQR